MDELQVDQPAGQAPLVTVGMPTYNRPNALRRAISSIQAQSYRNLDIVISDNASPDPDVRNVIATAARQDSRIRPFRQDRNIGPSANFIFVLAQSLGDFFMWAADDDEWDSTFIEKLLGPLLSHPMNGLSFCNFDVRYPDGELCLDYGPHYQTYEPFLDPDAVNRVFSYACQPPLLGKANIIYGLFRRTALRDSSVRKYFHSRSWGADMLFVCSVLSRWSFCLVPEKLYFVGIPFPNSALVSPADGNASSSVLKVKLKLAISHILYFMAFLRIMAEVRNSTLLDTLSLFRTLLPIACRWLREDFA